MVVLLPPPLPPPPPPPPDLDEIIEGLQVSVILKHCLQTGTVSTGLVLQPAIDQGSDGGEGGREGGREGERREGRREEGGKEGGGREGKVKMLVIVRIVLWRYGWVKKGINWTTYMYALYIPSVCT